MIDLLLLFYLVFAAYFLTYLHITWATATNNGFVDDVRHHKVLSYLTKCYHCVGFWYIIILWFLPQTFLQALAVFGVLLLLHRSLGVILDD